MVYAVKGRGVDVDIGSREFVRWVDVGKKRVYN